MSVLEADAAFRIQVDVRSNSSGVRYVAAACNGTRYAVTRSVLPGLGADYEGGPDLITVTSPWTDAHALQRTGYLHEAYVREHLCGGPLQTPSEGDVRALTQLVRYALNRVSAPEEQT